MKKLLLNSLLLLVNVCLFAQTGNQAKIDYHLQLQEKQVREICSVQFGEKQEVALECLKKKFGIPHLVTHDAIWFKNVSYGGILFEDVIFRFQTNAKRTYMNSCIFYGKKNKMEYVSLDFNLLLNKLKKYDLGASTENMFWTGGISPLWDGKSDIFGTPMYVPAIMLDIKKVDNGLCFLRLIYGQEQLCPFEYVKEDF